MEIKIESGANVQITDKPIVNNIVYGDVVQRKEVSLPEQSSTTSNVTKLSVQDILDYVESKKTICWSEVTSDYQDTLLINRIIMSCSSRRVAEQVISDIIKSMEAYYDLKLRQKMGENYSPNWKNDSEIAGPIWDLFDDMKNAIMSRFGDCNDSDYSLEMGDSTSTSENDLFKFVHPSLDSEQERQIHNEVKRLVTRQGIKEICEYLKKLADEHKILLPQSLDKAYAELVRMGMPNGKGFNYKTFTKYYKR